MTEEQKREHAEAIKHALGMASPEFGPPMEGEEGWVAPRCRCIHCAGAPADNATDEAQEGEWA